MYPLHLDLPSWTNAGGVIVLPFIILVILGAIIPTIAEWTSRHE